jgi:type IV pilus assembly protein PilF
MRKMIKTIAVGVALMILGGCASTAPKPETPREEAARINLKLGAGYMQSGHYDIALEKLNKALQYDDSLAEAHNAIAVLYEEIKEDGPAEHHYQRAIELDPKYTLARMNYGRFLCAHGKPADGEKQFLMAADEPLLQSPELVYIGAAVCARKQQAEERAEAHLRRALELNPGSPRALFELAELSLAQREPLQARAFLQRYHAVAGYSPASLWLGINIEEALGDIQARREYVRLLLAQFADSKEARRLQSE